jgi:serine protease inhibitor
MQQKRKEELHASEQAQEVAAELNALLARIDRYEFRVGNALWVERSNPLRQDYVEAISRLCEPGGVFPVDFKRDREASRRMINRWVEEQTAQRIENLIPSGLLSELTRLVISSAIYFAGEWCEPFDESWTRPRDFTMSNGSTREVPMMMAQDMESASYAAFNADGSCFETPAEFRFESTFESLLPDAGATAGPPRYPDAEGFLMLELAYKGDRLSMVLIAPLRHDGLPAIEEKLTATAVNGWIQQLRRRDVNVFIPSFEFKTSDLMSKYLLQMGMTRAFRNPLNPEGAEFYGMTESNNPEDHLFINEVIHKAYVKVDEMGTEAAAATAILMEAGWINSFVTPFTPTFNADRPFICIIRERPTGTILFMGRVMDPG